MSMYMIIYRLANGKAWKTTTITALTTIQFEDRTIPGKPGLDTTTFSGTKSIADPDPSRTASTETATHVRTPSKPEWLIEVDKQETSMV